MDRFGHGHFTEETFVTSLKSIEQIWIAWISYMLETEEDKIKTNGISLLVFPLV